MANKVYIKDKDGNDLLVATDWSIINGKPNNLATTNQLPTLGAVQISRITNDVCMQS